MSYVPCKFCEKPWVDGGHALCASRWQLQQAERMGIMSPDQAAVLEALIAERDPIRPLIEESLMAVPA